MDEIALEVTNREILGKKVRFLRRQGVTPVHLFGHGIESMSLQCDTATLRQALAEAGRTRLISLKITSEKEPRNVVVREVQTEPRTGESLHVDFYQVKMTEQVRVEVPIVLVGESPALKFKENMLVQELNTLTVECLPAKIPSKVEVDVTPLAEPEQSVRVKDIELDKEITILHEPEAVLAKISVQLEEEIEEPVVAEEAEEAAEAEAEAPEAAKPSEEEAKEE